MSSQGSFGSSMLFQTMNDDLNASLATADELSREFSSLLQEMNSAPQSSTKQDSSSTSKANTRSAPSGGSSSKNGVGISGTSVGGSVSSSSGTMSSKATMSLPQTSTTFVFTEPSTHSVDFTSSRNQSYSSGSPQSPQPNSYTTPQARRIQGHLTPPNLSPHTQRRASPTPMRSHERSLSGSFTYPELLSPVPSHKHDLHSAPSMLQYTTNPMAMYDSSASGRRSPRFDRVPSPSPLSQPAASTLPRTFAPFKGSDESIQKQRSHAKWNETDLDVSYEKKPHHTYDKNEWIRPSIPNSNWRESNLDSPGTSRKEPLVHNLQPAHGSLSRTARISIPPDQLSPTQSPYSPQPIISRISIPPSSSGLRQHRPIPLSVIMRLQNPYYAAATRYPQGLLEGEQDPSQYHQPAPPPPPPPLPREYLYQFQAQGPEQRQSPYSGEVLSSSDVDAEVERIITMKLPAIQEVSVPSAGQSKEPKLEVSTEDPEPPRPLSPTRLQPVVAPEVPVVPNMEELLRLRAEIPRALKKRGSVDQALTLKKLPIRQPNQYKQMIKKLFGRKGPQLKGEIESENSSSEGEESITPLTPIPAPITNTGTAQQKGLHSILRKSRVAGIKAAIHRARLSPLVLLLDGALVGELETVQKAVQEMSDPSQPNDEGITALHNAICGGHYAVVEFLVRVGANVSAPDSHGWTPLHCAASCNDRALCEFLVRNGAAVMAVTESDGATAAQKCDPFAVGYEECESFLRGVEEAMGVENSGVLYALWSYSAQAQDELSFKEGDMVTILQKPEGVDWWWASLCGREGFVPNNYFGLFPKVRPRTLC